jgi:tetratricopeptide (TPR) repeat protein
MYTFIISIALGSSVGLALSLSDVLGTGWSITSGVFVFILSQFLLGRNIQKKVKLVMDDVQGILTQGQKRLQAKMAHWQIRPPGSVQAAQAELMRDQKVFVQEALARTECLRKFKGWVPMIERQIATAQFQLHWMIKDFKKSQALMDKALFIDPQSCSIKLSLMYKNNASSQELGKYYEKAVKRSRYNQNVLPTAAYTWMLVQRGEIDSAFKVLNAALEKSDNEVLKRNRDILANNKVAHFTNSGLGDQWYSLFLEEPKVRTQRQRQQWR